MSIHDLLSSNKVIPLFPASPQLLAVNVTEPIDLSLGTTAMFQITALLQFSSSSTIDTMIIEYSDDETFPNNAEFPTEADPLDPATGLSILGNSIYNIYVTQFGTPRLLTATVNAGEDFGLPLDLGNFAFNVVVNVVNSLGTFRYCRVKFTATLNGADEEVMAGYGFVGPVRLKLSNGGIA